jgi:peptidoglycan biosynthesis protein MviN/MurJ (putative lipid II flippase)
LFLFPMRQAGLGLANTLSSVINVALLGFALRKKIAGLQLRPLWQQTPALVGSALLAGAAAWGLSFWWEARMGHGNVGLKVASVFLPAFAAALVYFGLCWRLKIAYMSDILRMLPGSLRRFFKVER